MVYLFKNSHAQTIDNNLTAKSSQGETLGNRQDAVVRQFVPAMEQELELVA